jgi:hypothetical protein
MNFEVLNLAWTNLGPRPLKLFCWQEHGEGKDMDEKRHPLEYVEAKRSSVSYLMKY